MEFGATSPPEREIPDTRRPCNERRNKIPRARRSEMLNRHGNSKINTVPSRVKTPFLTLLRQSQSIPYRAPARSEIKWQCSTTAPPPKVRPVLSTQSRCRRGGRTPGLGSMDKVRFEVSNIKTRRPPFPSRLSRAAGARTDTASWRDGETGDDGDQCETFVSRSDGPGDPLRAAHSTVALHCTRHINSESAVLLRFLELRKDGQNSMLD